MQGTIIENLVSKRAPAAGDVAETGSSTHPAPLAVSTEAFTYTGAMTITGSLSATSGQTGSWSGSLHETMTVYEDSSGNGFATEDFSGNVTLRVVNPDGSTKNETQPLIFTDPYLSLTGGKFSDSEPSDGLGGNLLATLTLAGKFGASHAIIAETMKIPFTGQVNGVLVNGSVNGTSQLTAKTPLAISGAVANQGTYAATAAAPFKNIAIVDLNGGAVTATVQVSNTKNGALTNLAGGKYNRAAGTYTITGSTEAVDSALDGLTFKTGPSLGGYNHPVKTGFTIKVSDTDGASLINRTTSIVAVQPLSIRGVSKTLTIAANTASTPFRYVTIGDVIIGENDLVSVKLSNPANGTLTNLGGGFYNKKTGVYAIKATAFAATTALRGLKFTPSGAAGAAGTSFKISVSNPAGAFAINAKTTVAVKAASPAMADPTASDGGVALFTQYVAAGFRTHDHAAGIGAVHDLAAGSHLDLTASHR